MHAHSGRRYFGRILNPRHGFTQVVWGMMFVLLAGCAHHASVPSDRVVYHDAWPAASVWIEERNLSREDFAQYETIVQGWLRERIAPIANSSFDRPADRRDVHPRLVVGQWHSADGPMATQLGPEKGGTVLYYRLVDVPFTAGLLHNAPPASEALLVGLSTTGMSLTFLDRWPQHPRTALRNNHRQVYWIPYYALTVFSGSGAQSTGRSFIQVEPVTDPARTHAQRWGVALRSMPELSILMRQLEKFRLDATTPPSLLVPSEIRAPLLAGYGEARWGMSPAFVQMLVAGEPQEYVMHEADRARFTARHGFFLPGSCQALQYQLAGGRVRYWFDQQSLFAVQIQLTVYSHENDLRQMLRRLQQNYGDITRRRLGYVALGSELVTTRPEIRGAQVHPPIRIDSFDVSTEAGGLHYVVATYSRREAHAKLRNTMGAQERLGASKEIDASVDRLTRAAETLLGYGASDPVRALPVYDVVRAVELLYYCRARTAHLAVSESR